MTAEPTDTAAPCPQLSDAFPRYREHDPVIPVWCVTPRVGRVIHRFYDTSPFSPSGRYLALTRLPDETRLPRPGDPAEVVLVDLVEGTERTIAETRGWDTQLGAQAQWGADDGALYFNDVDTARWEPFGVHVNPMTGARRELEGTIYMVSPDGTLACSPCLKRMARQQPGYGVVVPLSHVPRNRGAPDDDGIFITDLATGERRLLTSLRRIVAELELRASDFRGGGFYAFHVKWNASGDRLMLILRWLPGASDDRAAGPARQVLRRGARAARRNLARSVPAARSLWLRMLPPPFKSLVVTVGRDGAHPRQAIHWTDWAIGGHHPTWCPDGESIIMNLLWDGALRFVRVGYDGRGLGPLTTSALGSGHPTLHADGRHVLTDSYPGERLAFGDGTVPIRLIDLERSTETTLARIRVSPPFAGPRQELRVDPHPAWDRSYTRIAFNACPDGTRRVFVAEMTKAVLTGP